MKKCLTVQSQLSACLAEITPSSSSFLGKTLAQKFSSQSKDKSHFMERAKSTEDVFLELAREREAELREEAERKAKEDAKKPDSGEKEAGNEKPKGKDDK